MLLVVGNHLRPERVGPLAGVVQESVDLRGVWMPSVNTKAQRSAAGDVVARATGRGYFGGDRAGGTIVIADGRLPALFGADRHFVPTRVQDSVADVQFAFRS